MTKKETNKLDKLWSKLVRLKAKNKCEYCYKKERLNSHHIFSRSNRSTRWDVNNGVCLCVGHHTFGNMSAHKAPLEFAEWLKEKRGEQWYNELRMKVSISMKVDFEKREAYLLKELKKYD